MPRPVLVVRLMSVAALFALSGTVGADELRDAVDRVRQETGGYILSAQSLRTHGGTVHRVKVLTRDGRVEVRQIAAGVRGGPIGFTADGAVDAEPAPDDARRGRDRWRKDPVFGDDEDPRVRRRFESDRPAWADDGRLDPRGRVDEGLRSSAPSSDPPQSGRQARGLGRHDVEAPASDVAPPDRPPDQH